MCVAISTESITALLEVSSGEKGLKEGLKTVSQMMMKLIVEMIPRQHELAKSLQ